MYDKKSIFSLLDDIATCLELLNENPFKSSSYRKARRTLETDAIDFDNLIKDKRIDTIKGIGKAISEKIYNFIEKGISDYLEELKKQIPDGVFDILSLRGLGTKKTAILWHNLGVSNLGELEYACTENRLVTLNGFGELTQSKVLAEIFEAKKNKDYFLLSEGLIEAKRISEILLKIPEIKEFSLTSDLRRGMPVVNEIAFILLTDLKNINQEIKSHFKLAFHYADSKNYYTKLFQTTGNEKHIEYFADVCDNVNNETEIYRRKSINFIPPAIRENTGEIEKAINGSIPDLIKINDIKGIIHAHSVYSDGVNTISDLAMRCKEKGYEYLGISDHSVSAVYANGLNFDKILQQKEEIIQLNEQHFPFKIFFGIESDILKDGSLDYNEKTLELFDFVIASVHSNFTLNHKDMTERIIKAVKNPFTRILGHPLGRLLLARKAYNCDITRIIETCLQTNTAIEINANPHRLDLPFEHVKEGNDMGALFSINPDAHSIQGIDDIEYGVITGQKGWLTKEKVINCLNSGEIENFFKLR